MTAPGLSQTPCAARLARCGQQHPAPHPLPKPDFDAQPGLQVSYGRAGRAPSATPSRADPGAVSALRPANESTDLSTARAVEAMLP